MWLDFFSIEMLAGPNVFSISGRFESGIEKKSARGRVQKGYFRVCRVFLGIKSIKGRPDISDRPNMSGIPEILGDTRHFGLPDT